MKYSLLLCVLTLFPPAATAATAQPASPHAMADLRQIVREAVAAKLTRVVIPPGVYRGEPEKGGKVHLSLRKVSDLEIVADGVTLVCTRPTRAIDFNDCTRVTLRGITVDYDPLPFTQGDVVAADPAAGWLDVKLHAGYPVEPYTRIDICDRRTRYRKTGKPFMWGGAAEVLPGGVVRLHNRDAAKFAQPGDLASMGGEIKDVVAHAIVVDDSASVTLDHVTVFASNCMGIVAAGGDGDHRFLGCRIVPGPPPHGASEARILSVNADAILTGPMRKGVLTEGCEIRDAGDDSWSVQSGDYVILKRDGRTLWLAPRDMMALLAGDRLQASLDGPTAAVTSREALRRKDVTLAPEIAEKLAKAGRWDYWHLSAAAAGGAVCKVALDADVPWNAGDSLYDLDRQGNGFVFRNNTVRSSGRILIKAAGLVEGNRIEGPFGICARPEAPYPAAAGIAQLVIRGNTIIDAHLFNAFPDSPQAGAISVTADDDGRGGLRAAGVYGRVLIENNTIQGGNGAAIVVSSAREVAIRSNRLVNLFQIPPNDTGRKYHIDNHAAVWLANCDFVSLSGNVLLNPGPEMSRPLVCGPGVKKVEGGVEGK